MPLFWWQVSIIIITNCCTKELQYINGCGWRRHFILKFQILEYQIIDIELCLCVAGKYSLV
jgi:hypothetical protein